MDERITLVIQAGGRSTRMGEDKALKPFRGQPLILRVVERLAPLADEILVTTGQPNKYPFPGLRFVTDLVPGCGPLGGLYTGIASASHPIVAVAACDLPFASLPLFETAARLLVWEGADVVVPRSSRGLEPLHAVYRRETCLPVIRAAVESNQRKTIDWFSSVRILELGREEIAAADPDGLAFWNLNTPEDFLQAEQWSNQSRV